MDIHGEIEEELAGLLEDEEYFVDSEALLNTRERFMQLGWDNLSYSSAATATKVIRDETKLKTPKSIKTKNEGGSIIVKAAEYFTVDSTGAGGCQLNTEDLTVPRGLTSPTSASIFIAKFDTPGKWENSWSSTTKNLVGTILFDEQPTTTTAIVATSGAPPRPPSRQRSNSADNALKATAAKKPRKSLGGRNTHSIRGFRFR